MLAIDFLQDILQVIYTLVEIIAVVACVMLVRKHASLGTILMIIGAVGSFIITVCRTVIFALSSQLSNMDTFEILLDGVFALQAISYATMITGLLLFAMSYRKVLNS